MQLHHVTRAIPPSSSGSPTTLLAAQPMGESKQWWHGLLSVEHAAREPTPDLPLEPEDENGENMPDELPEEELPRHVSHAALRFRMRLAVSHAATVTSCWVCGAKHDEADCVFLQLALHDSMLSSVEALKPLGQHAEGWSFHET